MRMKDAERDAENAEGEADEAQTEWCACEEGNRGDDGDDGDPGPDPGPEPDFDLDDYPASEPGDWNEPDWNGYVIARLISSQSLKGAPKLPDYHFVMNLRSETFDDSFRKWLKPYAYLLAPNRASGAELDLAGNVRKGRYQLYADNGNFALIGQIVKKYAGDASTLLQAVRKEEKKLRHRPARRAEQAPHGQRSRSLPSRPETMPTKTAKRAKPR